MYLYMYISRYKSSCFMFVGAYPQRVSVKVYFLLTYIQTYLYFCDFAQWQAVTTTTTTITVTAIGKIVAIELNDADKLGPPTSLK